MSFYVRTARLALLALFALCLLWALFVHWLFLGPQRDEVKSAWHSQAQGPGIWASSRAEILVLQYFLVAAAFAAVLVAARRVIRPSGLFGAAGGLLGALWVNTQFFAVPYIGAYTSLPSMLVAHGIVGDNEGRPYDVVVIVTNLIIWLVIGITLGTMKDTLEI